MAYKMDKKIAFVVNFVSILNSLIIKMAHRLSGIAAVLCRIND
jgi:hypothetical protein